MHSGGGKIEHSFPPPRLQLPSAADGKWRGNGLEQILLMRVKKV
jgi:hypothetical protein